MKTFDTKDSKPIDVVFLRGSTKWSENNRFAVYKTTNSFVTYDKKNNEAIVESSDGEIYKVKNININNINPNETISIKPRERSDSVFIYTDKNNNSHYLKLNSMKGKYAICDQSSLCVSDLDLDFERLKKYKNKVFYLNDTVLNTRVLCGSSKIKLGNNDKMSFFSHSIEGNKHAVFNKDTGEIKSVDDYKFEGVDKDNRLILDSSFTNTPDIPLSCISDTLSYSTDFNMTGFIYPSFNNNLFDTNKYIDDYIKKNNKLPTQIINLNEQNAVNLIKNNRNYINQKYTFEPAAGLLTTVRKVFRTLLNC